MKAWLRLLAFALMGYACLGRGFAHLGVRPLYIGECVLIAGVLTAVRPRGIGVAVRLPIVWIWAAFACWGALRTIPFLGTYGLDAARDAVTWGYGIFAVLVAGFLLTTGQTTSVVCSSYLRWAQWFLILVPVPLVLTYLFGVFVPTPLSASVSLIDVKRGNAAVHLAGVLAFMIVGLADERATHKSYLGWLKTLLALVGFMISAAIVACASRSALLVLITATIVAVMLRPSARFILGSIPIITVALLLVIANPTYTMSQGRELSPQQIFKNFQTSFSSNPRDLDLDETREYRLQWWNTIIQYTIHGEYFWQGKGFGINLGQDDEFNASEDDDTRSPHNAFLCILARSGVIGLALWAVLQAVFVGSLIQAYRAARRARSNWWTSVNAWLLAYWAAFIVNSAFDVYLESPQGGIPFWSFFGLGIALLYVQSTACGDEAFGARRLTNVVASERPRRPIRSLTPRGPQNLSW